MIDIDQQLEIIYQDDYLVAVNKPHNIPVHKSKMARNKSIFVVPQLRNQIGQHVYPIHRLDSKTSGVLLFALSGDICGQVQQQFMDHSVTKKYWAIVRGHISAEGHIDYDLTNNEGKTQQAITDFKRLKTTEINIPFGKHATSRYSFVEVYPKTGRYHQLRKHFAHLRHPIIADRPHGCNKQNKFFKTHFNHTTMLLHCQELGFEHPITGKNITVSAPIQPDFANALDFLGFEAIN
jgi:tRNA pseudouridine65 synthase